MTAPSIIDAQNELRSLIERAQNIVGFTGAGISTECGVPDFRSPGSPWMTHKPIDFQLFKSSALMREEAWRRKFAMDDLYAGAQPGRGHRALAALVASGKMSCLVTQNIDGLHQASGIAPDRIVELHGNGTYAKCLGCGRRHELAQVRRGFEASGAAPECDCGGAIKSATISFGQAMPVDEMRRAQQAAESCDLFLAIGSSLVVYPAAGFPLVAQRNGATLVIINGDETGLDDEADVVLRGDIGDILEPFAA
jgi:NAD-dependent deacetylase